MQDPDWLSVEEHLSALAEGDLVGAARRASAAAPD
jgi:hypothetical protein